MRTPSLGEQELELLRFITEHAPLSVRDAVSFYGEPRGLARTTILTMMERLRSKGYLTRSEADRVYVYVPSAPKAEVLARALKGFVDKAFGGSASPIVAYLSREARVTHDDLEELKRLVRQLEAQEEGEVSHDGPDHP